MPFIFTLLLLSLYKFSMMVTIPSGIPYCRRIADSDGRCMQSKAFLKSMKFTITGFYHAVTFSIICLRANVWSLHGLPGLKTACSWRRFVSTALRILPSSTQANTLPRTDSRVMPRQLLQSDIKSPFLGSGMIIPFSTLWKLLCSVISVKQLRQVWYDCFSSSGWMWSVPAVLPFLSLLTARAILLFQLLLPHSLKRRYVLCVVFEFVQYIWLWTIQQGLRLQSIPGICSFVVHV